MIEQKVLTYNHCNTIVEGKQALASLYDYCKRARIDSPLWISPKNKRVQQLHIKTFASPYIRITSEQDLADQSNFDALIVCGGKQEIELCDALLPFVPQNIKVIHIPYGSLQGDEYTHSKGRNDITFFDYSLTKNNKKETIAQMMSVMLFYLFASTLQQQNSISLLSLRFLLAKSSLIAEHIKEGNNCAQASFIATTLLPIVGEVHSNSEHSPLIALMEHLVINDFSTLYQSAATLLIPQVLYIKETNSFLYEEIQHAIGNDSVEDFCRFWKNLSPPGNIEQILQQTIVQIYDVIQQEGEQLSFHQFLTFVERGGR